MIAEAVTLAPMPDGGGPGILDARLDPDDPMRRPHVYERSVPRARRDACTVPDTDPVQVARMVLRALPGLIANAELAGLGHLVDLLDAVGAEAERVEAGSRPSGS